MPCFHPLDAWQTFEGEIHFYARGTSGKKGAKAPNYRREIQLPCGKCVGCRLERSKQWAVRLMHEAQLHEWNSFLTLTLSDEELTKRRLAWEPAVPYTPPALIDATHNVESHTHTEARAHENSLSKRDLQLFLKRLRKERGTKPGSALVKYYAVGEYGEKLGRPHYHIALFGEDFSGDRYPWRKSPSGHQLWRSPRLEKIWGLGNCEIGELTFESAAYVARYIMKKITGPAAADHYTRTDPTTGKTFQLLPEFSLMSRGGRSKGSGGIASEWIEQFRTDVYPHDHVIMRGRPMKPPRYYDQQLAKYFPELLEEVKEERATEARIWAGDNSEARLRVKEEVALARLKQSKRTLE